MQQISFEQNKIATGFTIPENYFENFEDKIMSKIELKTQPLKVISLWQSKSVWISSVAALFIITVGIWYYFQENNYQDNVSSSEYLAFENDISTEDIAKHLTDEDLASLEEELNTFDTQTESYIQDYLN